MTNQTTQREALKLEVQHTGDQPVVCSDQAQVRILLQEFVLVCTEFVLTWPLCLVPVRN